MMDARMISVIQMLEKERDYLSLEMCAQRTNMSIRSFRQMMKESGSSLWEAGVEIIYKSNRGYRLQVHDMQQLQSYMKNALMQIKEEQYERPVTSMDRKNWMIRHFLLERNGLKSDDLIDQLFISKSTFASDLKMVKEELAKYHLSLESKIREGLYVSGNESDIRRCISDYFFYDGYVESDSFQNQELGKFDLKYQNQVEEIVMRILDENQYQMTDVGIHNLIIHLLIALFRIECGAKQDASSVEEEKYPQEFEMSRRIRDEIAEVTGIRIDDDNLGYMVIHMIGTRILTSDDENLIHSETLNMVRAILSEILNVYGIDLFADIDLFTMLCTHLEPMISRIRNHVKMRNPILDQVQEQEPLGYEMAVLASGMIEKEYDAQVDENEIGYLALHFDLALQRRNQLERKKILTVCASGMGTSRLLMYRLKENFGSQIESIDSAGLNELSKLSLDKYDLIVTTVPLKLKTAVKVLQVQYFLSDSDVQNIQQSFEQSSLSRDVLSQIFEEDLFFGSLKANSSFDVIHLLCKELGKRIKLPAAFETSVLAREKLSSTAMGNGFAMPHPRTLMADETKIVTAHLKNPVSWGKQKVQWVFLLCMQKQQDETSEPIIQALYTLLNHPQLKNQLDQNPDYECLLKTISSLVEENESQPQESIFQ